MEFEKTCSGCVYWRGSSGGGDHLCHYYLDTGKRRVKENGVCRSRTPVSSQDKPHGGLYKPY